MWISDGALAGATAERALDGAAIAEVVFELLRYGSGSFIFGPDELPPEEQQATDPADVEDALRRASELLDEWRELETVVPSLNHRVAIAPELTVDKVTVDAARWKTLVAIAGGLAVGELAETLELGELAVCRTVSDLVELGVVTVQEPTADGRRAAAPRRGRSERPERPERPAKEVPPRRAARADGNGQGEPGRREAPEEPVGAAANGRRPVRRSGREQGAEDDGSMPARGAADAGAPGGAANGNGNGNGLPRRSRATGQRGNRPAGGASVPLQAPGDRTDAGGQGHPGPARQVPGVNGAPGPGPERGHPGPYSASAPPAPAPTSASQGLASLPPFDNNEPSPSGPAGPAAERPSGPILPSSLDTGPLAPAPRPSTGQVPVVTASSLPHDLSWAEDDDVPGGAPLAASSPPVGNPPVAPPQPPPAPRAAPAAPAGGMPASPPMGSPLVSGQGAPPDHRGPAGLQGGAQAAQPLAEGEIAPHVALLSPGARMAVETTVGRSGGGAGVVPAAGGTQEEAVQRGALLGFLSSVRS